MSEREANSKFVKWLETRMASCASDGEYTVTFTGARDEDLLAERDHLRAEVDRLSAAISAALYSLENSHPHGDAANHDHLKARSILRTALGE